MRWLHSQPVLQSAPRSVQRGCVSKSPALKKTGLLPNLPRTFALNRWRQLQRVLVEMGHAGEARELGIIYEQQLRAIGHVGQPPSGWPTWIAAIYSRIALGLHALYGLLTGYGYRPMLGDQFADGGYRFRPGPSK